MNSLKKYGFLRKSFALSKNIIFNILFQIISTKLGFSHLSVSPFIFEVFMSDNEVRVRYAPSPTGMQHIGGVRTALFNYLYARSKGGKFILRLEDTDRTRFDEKYVENLYDTMSWLGIDWDEGGSKGGEYGPYEQSERAGLYKKHAMELVEKGEIERLSPGLYYKPKITDYIKVIILKIKTFSNL